ncbi:hypothetical protein A7U60_g2772 [Sanghuangporus baumii]|uniref:Uncharacterized protein n=1 Tax=Sanghuangporus baumii TaxID=108892 RepID=A0A9Q5I1K8_SANBA|nr:hypothetical protein A7U60_g2772 [Sanghuangporus baumii]
MSSTTISQQVSSTARGPSSPSSVFSSLSSLSSSTFGSEDAGPTAVNDDDDMRSVSRSSSLLFGFLITFLALFIGFMACGYSSRRAAHIRGTRHVTHMRNVEYNSPVKMKKPRLWDMWVDEGVRENRWRDMMPLSVTFIHPSDEKKRPVLSSPGVPNQPPLHETFPQHEYLSPFISGSRAFARLDHSLPSPLPGRSRRTFPSNPDSLVNYFIFPRSNTSSRSQLMPTFPNRFRSLHTNHNERSEGSNSTSVRSKGTKEDMKDIQAHISVIIAMPSPTSSSRSWKSGIDDGVSEENGQEDLGVYEIGVTKVHLTGLTGRSTSMHEG